MRICQEIWILGALGASETDEGGINVSIPHESLF